MKRAAIVRERQMNAEDAASMISDSEVLGCSGFTPAGYPKAISIALAKRARRIHEQGQKFRVALYTGASVGDELDGELARAHAVSYRIPYQSNPDMREGINSGEVEFVDFHLSHLAQYVRYGFLPHPKTAIVEAADITDDGKIYLTMSGGMSPTYCQLAERVFVELNERFGDGVKGLHDIYIPESPPARGTIPIFHPGDRIGVPYIQVDPKKITGIILTNQPDLNLPFKKPDEVSRSIADRIIDFIQHEQRKGRMPKQLPYQSGVGNVANAVLAGIASYPNLEAITMYTEVIQDSIFELLDAERLEIASTCSLTLSPEGQARFQQNISSYKDKFIIRSQEVSNNPEIIRRLGVISMNTALEIDIFGNVNSTHVLGSKMMNGIGGSGDFCRNAYVSIYMVPSITKGGAISSVVPMVSHVDHNEHSVQVVVTENGLADLRGLSPVKRARLIIENCAHPDYRDLLRDYLAYGLEKAPSKHTPHLLERAFEFHLRLMKTGTMQC
ncbi:MAG: succinate CoA transferase [SAR324 cluster bacterium]|uniref:Succinate CoA transferase n=1 Tax=SAR324 cluster bacterium TaxID=2024889 RepID=A0A7X9IKL4_9DELT|nr:succinate CoA transferase [SAR324 cluster bacterium]